MAADRHQPGRPPRAPAAGHRAPAVANAVAGGRGTGSGGAAAVVARRAAGRAAHRAATVVGLCAAVGDWHGVRGGSGLAGQVPPAGSAGADGRGRAVRLRHLFVVFGARPGTDAAGGGNCHHGADFAGAALAAQTRGGTARHSGPAHAAPGAPAPGARPGCVAGRRRRHGAAGAGDAAPSLCPEHLHLLSGKRPDRGRRHQRGQRDAGGLSRL